MPVGFPPPVRVTVWSDVDLEAIKQAVKERLGLAIEAEIKIKNSGGLAIRGTKDFEDGELLWMTTTAPIDTTGPSMSGKFRSYAPEASFDPI